MGIAPPFPSARMNDVKTPEGLRVVPVVAGSDAE